MYEIVISDIPPTNNKFIGRTNRWEYQNTKNEWLAIVSYSIKQKPSKPLEKAIVHLHYIFSDRRRRDPDNYSGKMILDALVKNGMILDDSFNNIELVLSAEYQKGIKRTVIKIEKK